MKRKEQNDFTYLFTVFSLKASSIPSEPKHNLKIFAQARSVPGYQKIIKKKKSIWFVLSARKEGILSVSAADRVTDS